MSLVYLEFISRRPGVSLEQFHAVAGQGQTGWAGDNTEDVLLANLGRSWRTGPEPEYIAFWHTRAQGLDRFDDWERIFRSGVAEQFEEPFRLAARIERGGSYDALLEPVPVDTERCYLEFFDFAGGARRDEVCAAYEERAGRHGDLKLNVLLDRIGRLGPTRAASRYGACPPGLRWRRSPATSTATMGPFAWWTPGMYSEFGKETL